MKLKLSGFEGQLELSSGHVAVLEVCHQMLFSRIVQSLYYEKDGEAVEPFCLVDEDGDLRSSRNQFLFVFNPFDLPWEDKALLGEVLERLEVLFAESDSVRQSIEACGRGLSCEVESLGLQMQSDYAFEVEWNLRKYLKSFSFGVDVDPDDPLIDNLIKFVKLVADASFDKVLVFVNLKKYLTEYDLREFYRQVIFSGITTLLLEGDDGGVVFDEERKMTIDQDFLES